MSPSSATRNQLVSPLVLLMLVALFAAGFWLLLPRGADLRQGSGSLDLAYLRAEIDRGELQGDALLKVLMPLAKAGRHAELDALKAQLEPGALQPQQLLLLDLAGNDRARLLQQVDRLLAMPSLHSISTIELALTRLQDVSPSSLQRTHQLYRLVATLQSSDEGANSFADCGAWFAAIAEPALARECYADALAQSVHDGNRIQAWSVAWLRQHLKAPPESDEPELLARHRLQSEVMLRRLLNDMQLSSAELEMLADDLLAAGRPDLAWPLMSRLAEQDQQRRQHWLGQAARWAEASEDLDAAAKLVQLKMSGASDTSLPAVRAEFRRLMLAAGKQAEALLQIEQEISPAVDDATLKGGIELALSSERHALALDWNRLWLARYPLDADAWQRQIDIALATGEIALAEQEASEAVRLLPDSLELRRRLARVKEWNGEPDDALTEWRRIADQAAEADVVDEVVRLAAMTQRPGVAADALAVRVLKTQPDQDSFRRLLDLYSRDGRPEVAEEVAEAIMREHGELAENLRQLRDFHRYYEYHARALAVAERLQASGQASRADRLAHMELLWRQRRFDEARALVDVFVAHPLDRALIDQIREPIHSTAPTTFKAEPAVSTRAWQLRMLVDMAWRYDLPWLGDQLAPLLESIVQQEQRDLASATLIDQLVADRRYNEAMPLAQARWQQQPTAPHAESLMQLAFATGNDAVFMQFMPGETAASGLLEQSGYWNRLAEWYRRRGDLPAAEQAWQQALLLNPENAETLAARLWQAIDTGDDGVLRQRLDDAAAHAPNAQVLWAPMAIGLHLNKRSSESLVWFRKLVDDMDGDYSLTLAFADALERAGRAETALQVRRHVFNELRPRLVAAADAYQDDILQQYSQLAGRYASVQQREILLQHFLATPLPTAPVATLQPVAAAVRIAAPAARGEDEGAPGMAGSPSLAGDSDALSAQPEDASGSRQYWRDDLAISWLMATQRSELARLVMTELHRERLSTPSWQALALAVEQQDRDAFEPLLATLGNLSFSDQLVALRAAGRDAEAYSRAKAWLRTGQAGPERRVVERHYTDLRPWFPTFVGAQLRAQGNERLGISEQQLVWRQSITGSSLGFGLDARVRQLDAQWLENSGISLATGQDQQQYFELALYAGDRQRGARLGAGVAEANNEQRTHASASGWLQSASGRSRLAAELAWNAPAEGAAELQLAARQHQIGFSFEQGLGLREFLRLGLETREVHSLVEGQRLARGLTGSVELGVRGRFGVTRWNASVAASGERNSIDTATPNSMTALGVTSNDALFVDAAQFLSVGGGFSRGGVAEDWPSAPSPRFYLNARLGHRWPERDFGVQIDMGAGTRVFGRDELGLRLQHDSVAGRFGNGSSSLGLSYRYHFR